MSEQSPGWQIATACDIELGKHFQPGQMFEGKRLDIDADAIQATIEQLSPEAADRQHQLLFQAAHMTSNVMSPDRSLSRGLFCLDLETGEMEVDIAVVQPSHVVQITQGLPVPFNKIFKDRAASPSILQKAPVHELQHAVDYTDEDQRAIFEQEYKLTRANELFVSGVLAMRKTAYVLGGFAVGASGTSHIGANKPLEMAAGLLGAGVGSKVARLGWKRAARQAYGNVESYKYTRKDTSEKRARAAARHADDYPQIISIH